MQFEEIFDPVKSCGVYTASLQNHEEDQQILRRHNPATGSGGQALLAIDLPIYRVQRLTCISTI